MFLFYQTLIVPAEMKIKRARLVALGLNAGLGIPEDSTSIPNEGQVSSDLVYDWHFHLIEC
jgi:hypothetical protein